jgi:hypothetical protein
MEIAHQSLTLITSITRQDVKGFEPFIFLDKYIREPAS